MPKDSTVKDLDELHFKAKAARSRLEPTWYMSLAYYEGRQWLTWGGGRLYQPDMPRTKMTIVDNRVQPIVRKEIARLTKNQPVFNVIPTSPDEEDSNAASVGDAVMVYLWRHLKLAKLREKALRWSRITGAGFMKAYWDPTVGESTEVLMSGGEMLPHPQTGGPIRADSPEAQMVTQIAQNAGQQVIAKRVALGDIRVEVRSPFQMFTDPLADTFEECEWLIEESVKSAEYVKRRYNVEVEADTPANPGLVEARLGSPAATNSGGYMGVRLREYWCKPNTDHPSGCRTVWVAQGDKGKNGKVLLEDSEPFDPMPYVMFSAIPVPGRLWPTCVTEQLIGPQTELNKVKSQIAENRNRVGNPTVLASKQAVQDPGKFIQGMTQPGGVVFFDDVGSPNSIPTFLQAPNMPEYVIGEIELIQQSLQEISGQHEVSSAQVPPGVTAASAIELLQEADDTMIAPDVFGHELELSAFGEKLLKLVGRYYTDSRTIRISGDDGAWQIFDFRGSMLNGNTRVEVQAGSAFPRSKAARQAQMQDILMYMAQSGQPLQGRALAQFFEDFGLGGLTRFTEQFSRNEQQCNRENALMAQGRPLRTNEYDDDEQHVANHEDFQRSSRYALLVAQSPQIGQIFEDHVAQHRQKLMLLQQQQVQMALQAQGQPTAGQQDQQQQMAAQQAQAQAQQQGQQAQQQQAQAAQQMDIRGAQAGQQQDLQTAQQQQQLEQAQQAHHQRLEHQQQLHEARMRQMAQQQTQGANRGQSA